VLKQHTKASWNALKGVDPTDEEITQLLSLIRVLTLDVDPAETHEREAKDLLRQSVLKTPSDTDTAYSRLVAACATFAANRTGANRAELQAILVNAGIDIEGVNSFQADIQKLQEASVTNLQALSGLSEVRLSPTAVLKIARDSTSALKEAVERESLVVVGQPGAGKTGALYDLANGLAAIGDVLVFGVDHFEAKSLASLRIELGCTHDVLQVLGNWPGLRPGFLIIDALDAARTDLGAKTFRELIAAVLALNGRWRVIPSIRKYDLRHSSELKSLFVGAPHSTFHDPEFGRVKHIEIPVLSDAELTEVGRQSPELGGIVAGASPALKQLLRIPFNLRLCAEMLGAGAAATAISPVKTQIDLLNLYWRERVLRSDQQGDARESVLRTATSKMVEGRTLRIPRSVVAADPSASTPLHQILSSQLLIEWQQSPRSAADRYILAYSHHILYDYAISRLLLRGPLSDVLSWLETQPDLMLAIRPSLMFHYQHLWTLEETRDSFWEYVFSFFKSNTLPDIGKIIGPLVAAQLSSDIQDFQPLINAMRDNNSPNHEASKEAFRHLLGAAHSENSTGAKPLVGENAPPWAELLKEVASI
jgi:hypothetical protein